MQSAGLHERNGNSEENSSVKKLPLVLSFLFITRASAQDMDHYAWVKLSGNRVMVNVQLLDLHADSLIVVRDGRPVVVPISYILGLKVLRGSSILGGTALGAGIGAFGGAALGTALSSGDNDSWNPVSASLYGCVIGGIIGAVTSSSGNTEMVLDLEKASMDERVLLLRDLIKSLQMK